MDDFDNEYRKIISKIVVNWYFVVEFVGNWYYNFSVIRYSENLLFVGNFLQVMI